MSFLAIMGANLAMNLLGKLFTPKPPQISPPYATNMSQTLAKNSAEMQAMWDEKPVATQKVAFDFQVPDPPSSAVSRLAQMQDTHENQRTAFLNSFHADRNKMKEDFYANNHLKTGPGQDGKEQVLAQNGKPTVEPGKENGSQKIARENFEATNKAEMFARHAQEKTAFVQDQRQQLMTFMDANKFQLANPGVQGELSRLIVDGQKKALNIQHEHEDEYYKIDLPTKEMKDKVDGQLTAYRGMVQEHAEKEENSKEAKQLANYQHDLVALLDAKREEAREEKKAEMFLMDPRKAMKGQGPKQDLASQLPMNLVAALEDFGIHNYQA